MDHHFYCEKNDHRIFTGNPEKRMADDYQDPTRREREEQERKEKEKKYRIKMIEAFIQTASITLNRYHNVRDPVIRYSLVLDKFCLLLEFLSGMALSYLEIEEVPSDLLLKAEKLIEGVHEEMQKLSEWIQQPHYSPDAPLGKDLMNEAKKDFTQNSSSSTYP